MAQAPSQVEPNGRMRALVSQIIERAEFASRAGLSFRNAAGLAKRDVFEALGYHRALTAKDYRDRYERGGIAERIVEAYPRGTWSGGAYLVEDATTGTNAETTFELAAKELFERLDLWARLMRADILSGLGSYAVLLIGASGELSTPLPTVTSEEGVLYFTPLGEARATIDKVVADTTEPRFGLPEYYKLTLGKSNTKRAHWSRVLHLSEGVLEDDVFGKPRLRGIWNYLDDLTKVVGGGSEAAWVRANPGMQLDLAPEVELDGAAQEKLSDEIDEFVHGYRRVMRTRGVDVNLLAASVTAFGSNATAVLQLISATTGIPLRILIGSERGELASTQDRTNWADRIAERRREFAVPLIGQLVERLVEAKALPEPTEYEVVWPEIDELNEDEKADVTSKLATANKAQKEAEGRIIISANEIRDMVHGLGPLEDLDLDVEDELEQLRGAADSDPDWGSVHRAADRHRMKIARLFLAFWVATGAAIEVRAFETAVAQGNVDGATRAVSVALDTTTAELARVLPGNLHAVLVSGARGGQAVVNERGSWFRGAGRRTTDQATDQATPTPELRAAQFEAHFNAVNPRALEWSATRSSALITEVTDDTKAAVRAMIAEGIEQGIPPAKLRRQIMQRVGLRTDQAGAISKFAKRNGLPLSHPQVVKRAKLARQYRATLIARTETMRSANAGQVELWQQATDSGDLPAGQKRMWITTFDGFQRDSHGAMNGQVRGLQEKFERPDGKRINPGEEPNCRCVQGLASPEAVARAQNTVAETGHVRDVVTRAALEGRTLDPDEVWRNLPQREQDKVTAHIRRAAGNDPEYRALIDEVAESFDMTLGDFENPFPGEYFYGPLKKAERVVEKALYDGDGVLDTVGDILRMTYVVDDPADALKVYEKIKALDDPVGMKNRMLKPGWGGYRDMIMKVRLKDGMLAEVQINTRNMLIAKNGRGHEIYDILRKLPEGSDEWLALAKESEKLYGDAWIADCRKWPGFGGCKPIGMTPEDRFFWQPEHGWAGESVDDVAKAIRGESMERGAAWDAEGRFRGGYSSNSAKTLDLPDQAMVPGGRHIHNHPAATSADDIAGSSFSPGDIDTATWFRLDETRVVSILDGEDVTYVARGFDKLTADAGVAGELGQKISERLYWLVTKEADQAISRPFMRGVWGMEPSQSFGFALRTHWAMRQVAKEFGFTYEATWYGRIGSLDQFGSLDDALAMAGVLV
jgi:hypothetical protein